MLKKYWDERGGKIQWLAQCVAQADDLETDVKKAIDGGAAGAFLIGNVGDEWSRAGKVDLIGKFLDFVKANGVITGVGGHNLGTLDGLRRGEAAGGFLHEDPSQHRTTGPPAGPTSTRT